MRVLTLLPLLALLAACQPAPEVEEPADAPAAPEAPAEQPRMIDTRAVSAQGVGPIRADTPFDREAIAALFPASNVQAEFLHFGEATTPIITVTGPEEIALEIQGATDGHVGQVHVLGGPFTGPNGERLLDPWPELGLTAGDCAMGEGRFVGQPVCRLVETPHLALVLSVPNWREPTLPDPTTLNGRARLAGWLWTAPR